MIFVCVWSFLWCAFIKFKIYISLLLCVNQQGCHISCVSLWREADWETLCCEGLEENCKLIDFIGAYFNFSWNPRMTEVIFIVSSPQIDKKIVRTEIGVLLRLSHPNIVRYLCSPFIIFHENIDGLVLMWLFSLCFHSDSFEGNFWDRDRDLSHPRAGHRWRALWQVLCHPLIRCNSNVKQALGHSSLA